MKRVPPDDVDGASAAGELKGEEGAACPKPVEGAPNPEEGNPLLEPAGEAGWEPNAKGVLDDGNGALNEKGDGWLKVEGLLGVDAVGPVTNKDGGADGAVLPNEKGAGGKVGVNAPPNENPPPEPGR